jgi:transcriptional regulator with XRE-family HTH domain
MLVIAVVYFQEGAMSLDAEELRRLLSANIKNRRKLLGLSQEKLAEAAGLSAQTINDIEGCRMWVSDKTLVKLTQALQVEVYQLLVPFLEVIKEESGSSTTEILTTLREKIRKTIDLQFCEALNSEKAQKNR